MVLKKKDYDKKIFLHSYLDKLMSPPKNLEYKKTSFLSKSNSSFIEEMYIKYIEKDPSLPVSWENYFKSLNED